MTHLGVVPPCHMAFVSQYETSLTQATRRTEMQKRRVPVLTMTFVGFYTHHRHFLARKTLAGRTVEVTQAVVTSFPCINKDYLSTQQRFV